MNIISFFINILIGLWLVPYYISNLGVAAYGLIPIAMVFTEYVSLFTISINGSIARFLTISIQKNNWIDANKIFNTSLLLLIGIIVVLLPCLLVFSSDINSYIEIPSGLERETFYLFIYTFCGFFLSLISGVFSTSLYANNRIDLIKTIDLVRIASRVISIVALFAVIEPSLLYVGIANLIAALISFVLCIWFWRKLTPKLAINFRFFDKTIVRAIGSMGGWLVVNKLGSLLFLKIDLLIINRLIGPDEAGKYAAIQQWNILIGIIAAVFGSVFGPMILISYAKEKMNDVIKMGKMGIKYITIGIGLITGIIIGLAAPLLKIWLGADYLSYAMILAIMIIHLPINLAVDPLFSVFSAQNKVKIPGLVTLSLGFLNLLFAVSLVLYTDLGVVGVALSGAIIMTIKNAFFTPWYASKILNIDGKSFGNQLFYGIGTLFLSFSSSKILSTSINISNWLVLTLSGVISAMISLIIVWLVFLKKDEKHFILSYIPKKAK